MLFSVGRVYSPAVRPAHEFDLKDYKFDVSLDFAAEIVRGTVTNTLITTKDNANLAFDKGPMKILSVKVDGAKSFKTSQADGYLNVSLSGVKKGTSLKVIVKYEAHPEAGIYFVAAKRAYPSTTSLAYTQGEMEDNRYWLPIYDYPDDKATTEGIIRVPKGMSVLSNGTLVSHIDQGEQSVWHWRMDKEISTYLISLVAGSYTAVPDGSFKGKPVQIWTPKGVEDWGRAAFKGTDNQIAIYSKLTGIDYPWQKYAQSAVPEFMFGGMENASCTTQTINALFPVNSKGTESGEGLSAHELAHQWFGDLITAKNWSHIWVNEGWASFMPHFIVRERHGEDEYNIGRYGTYQGAYYSCIDRPMVRYDYTVPMEMFDGNAYPGGATRMFMLMHILGEDQFWKCCKAYLTAFGHKNVTTEDFFANWSKTSGVDLDQFRKQWYYQKGSPQLSVTKDGDNFVVEQTSDGFVFDVDVQRLDENSVLGKKTIHFDGKGSVTVPAEGATTLIVDPGAWLMCAVKYQDYTDSQWTSAWRNAENAAQKMRILERIQQNPHAIRALYEWEKSWPVRKQLIPHLTDSARLIELCGADDESLVKAAMDRLAVMNDPGAKVQASRIFAETKNEALKNDAYRILLSINNDEATAKIGWNLKTYNLATKAAALNWYAEHDKAKARTMALDAVKNYAPGPVRMTAISVLGRVKDAEGSREVFNLLISIAKAHDYAPMQAAINALADYGDKAAIPVIESRKDHSLHFARGTVQSALARLNRR